MRKPVDRFGAVNFWIGMGLSTLLWGCVSASFPYHFYGMDMVSYNGYLRGPKPTDDLSASVCAPTDIDKAPCTIMLTKDFEALQLDYEDGQEKLEECESSK